eukprot:Gb_10849 [translate_table: standard]
MAPNTGSCGAEESSLVHSEQQQEKTRNDGKQNIFNSLSGRPTLRPITCSSSSSSSSLRTCRSVESSSNSNSSSIDTDSDFSCNGEEVCTTPKAKEYRIPEFTSCPPAPRKHRVPSRFLAVPLTGFFIPPDLDSMFPLHKITVNM